MDGRGHECEKPIEDISCELVPCRDAPTVRCSVKKGARNKYEIRYNPTTRGQHQLHVKVEREHAKGSPFSVTVKIPVEKLGTPNRTIGGLNQPWGVAVNERGHIVVAEWAGHCVSIFSPQGEKIRTFGTKGSAPQLTAGLEEPRLSPDKCSGFRECICTCVDCPRCTRVDHSFQYLSMLVDLLTLRMHAAHTFSRYSKCTGPRELAWR